MLGVDNHDNLGGWYIKNVSKIDQLHVTRTLEEGIVLNPGMKSIDLFEGTTAYYIWAVQGIQTVLKCKILQVL